MTAGPQTAATSAPLAQTDALDSLRATAPLPDSVGLPGVVETGNAAVDAALARLAGAREVPAEARAGVYGEVHDLLRDTLAGLDERTGGAPTPLNVIR